MRQLATLTIVLLVAVFVVDAQASRRQPQSTGSHEINTPAKQHNSGSWITLDKAMALANLNHKKVLIDFMADWCIYCKKMDKEVFPQKDVQNLLSKYFYTVKINVESKDQVTFQGKTYTKEQFAQAFGVSGLPTYLFIDSSGKAIAGQPGYIPAPDFVKILSYIGSDSYKKMTFKAFSDMTGR